MAPDLPPTRPWARRRWPVAAVALAALAVAACSSSSSTADPPEPTSMSDPLPAAPKGDRGEVRDDLEPLTKRFPALGDPVGATWQGGTFGDDRVPGPSTYWIDAVVELEPATAEALAADTGAEPTDPPEVDDALATAVPDGPWVRSGALDKAFSTSDFHAEAHLDVEHATVVLLLEGGNP